MKAFKSYAPLLFVLFLFSCEGGTTFTKVVENNSSETITLTVHRSSPVAASENFDLEPGERKTIFWDDHLGNFVDDSYTCTFEIDSITVNISNNKNLTKSLMDNQNWEHESKGGRNSEENCTFNITDMDLE